MARVLDELRRDHRNMAKILAIIEGQIRLLRDGRIADLELVERALDYCIAYPDRCHHPKEDLVFARVAALDPATGPTIERLADEHQEMARLTGALAETVRAVNLGEPIPREQLVHAAEAYVSLNRRHIREEEAEIFPCAEQNLAPADWALMDEVARPQPDPVFGGSIEERYLALHRRILQLHG